MENRTCKERVRDSYNSTMKDITKLWNLYKKDPDASNEDLGTWSEYGLCFDYLPRGTFNDQKRGFFRFQISTGGPGEEIRFYTDENLDLNRVEFWFLDWFGGAKINMTGKNLQTITEIWEDWKEIGLPEQKMKEAND